MFIVPVLYIKLQQTALLRFIKYLENNNTFYSKVFSPVMTISFITLSWKPTTWAWPYGTYVYDHCTYVRRQFAKLEFGISHVS